MRFMMIVKASARSEAGEMPGEALLAAMADYNEQLVKAGAMIDGTGLHPSSRGARVLFRNGTRTVVDGPFSETKELIAGFWMIEAESLQQAIEWAKRSPAPHGDDVETNIEIRQVFTLDDFEPSPALDKHRRLESDLAKRNG